jgi:hypothetical protein
LTYVAISRATDAKKLYVEEFTYERYKKIFTHVLLRDRLVEELRLY